MKPTSVFYFAFLLSPLATVAIRQETSDRLFPVRFSVQQVLPPATKLDRVLPPNPQLLELVTHLTQR
ncbi:hypothetical protein BH24ACI1_BH24ACI1_18390 [soil metagenome]